MPAGDIAENPYWKRDVRRSYPKLSVVRQPDVVALLSVGSAAQPKEDKLQIGEAGKKQLVALKEEGEKGLSAFFEKEKSMAAGVLGPNGMPPLPARYGQTPKEPKYVLDSDEGQAYGPKYVQFCVTSLLQHVMNTDVFTATLAGPLYRRKKFTWSFGVYID